MGREPTRTQPAEVLTERVWAAIDYAHKETNITYVEAAGVLAMIQHEILTELQKDDNEEENDGQE